MKRTLMLGTGMAVLSVAIYLGSTLSAQQTAPATQAPQAPQTKIALINLNYIVKNYQKFIAFQGEMKGILTKYQETDMSIGKQFETKSKQLADSQTPPAAKAQLEQELLSLKQQREVNSVNGKKVITEKSDQGMVTFYAEVQNAAKVYARARGIDLVLHYNDSVDEAERGGATNVARKLQAGACIPVDFAPGMDISAQIVQMLNQAYAPARPAGSAGTTAPAGTAPRQ